MSNLAVLIEEKKLIKGDGYKREKDTRRAENISSYFIKSGNKLVTKMEIAKILHAENPKLSVSHARVSMTICDAREYLEINHNKTLQNVVGEGWRIATPKEQAIYLVRQVKRVTKHAERVRRVYNATDKALIPDAVKQVFGTTKHGQKHITDTANRFKALFGKKLLSL